MRDFSTEDIIIYTVQTQMFFFERFCFANKCFFEESWPNSARNYAREKGQAVL